MYMLLVAPGREEHKQHTQMPVAETPYRSALLYIRTGPFATVRTRLRPISENSPIPSCPKTLSRRPSGQWYSDLMLWAALREAHLGEGLGHEVACLGTDEPLGHASLRIMASLDARKDTMPEQARGERFTLRTSVVD